LHIVFLYIPKLDLRLTGNSAIHFNNSEKLILEEQQMEMDRMTHCRNISIQIFHDGGQPPSDLANQK